MPIAKEASNSKMNIFTISVPRGAETTFLRRMSRNMGWKVTVSRQKEKDPTAMTKEEYFAKIDRAKQQVKDGEMGPKFDSAKDLIEYLKTL